MRKRLARIKGACAGELGRTHLIASHGLLKFFNVPDENDEPIMDTAIWKHRAYCGNAC